MGGELTKAHVEVVNDEALRGDGMSEGAGGCITAATNQAGTEVRAGVGEAGDLYATISPSLSATGPLSEAANVTRGGSPVAFSCTQRQQELSAEGGVTLSGAMTRTVVLPRLAFEPCVLGREEEDDGGTR
jgi:hypothetical protein